MAEAEDSGGRSCYVEGERTGSAEDSGNESKEDTCVNEGLQWQVWNSGIIPSLLPSKWIQWSFQSNGRVRWMAPVLSPEAGEDPERDGMVLVFAPVTEFLQLLDLLELVEKLQAASSAERMREEGAALVEKVKTVKLLERQSILEKIRLLTQERDNALAKKQSLEVEISRLQHQLEMMETEYRLVDKTRVKTLQTQLQAALNEKEAWQQKATKFEDTCETLKIISSLQRSMYKEDDIKRKYETEILKFRAEKKALVEQLEHTLQERNHIAQERTMLIQERNALALQYQQEFERAERFQRLVFVLRKKAMCGTGDSVQY